MLRSCVWHEGHTASPTGSLATTDGVFSDGRGASATRVATMNAFREALVRTDPVWRKYGTIRTQESDVSLMYAYCDKRDVQLCTGVSKEGEPQGWIPAARVCDVS